MVKELFESNEFEIEKFEFEVKVEWMKWKYLKMTRNENIEEKKLTNLNMKWKWNEQKGKEMQGNENVWKFKFENKCKEMKIIMNVVYG